MSPHSCRLACWYIPYIDIYAGVLCSWCAKWRIVDFDAVVQLGEGDWTCAMLKCVLLDRV